MLIYGVIASIFLMYYLYNHYNELKFLSVLVSIVIFFLLFEFKIPISIVMSNIDVKLFLNHSLYGIFLIIWVVLMQKITSSYLADDIKRLSNYVFKDNRFIYFGLFFLAQFSFGGFILSFIFYYTIAKIVSDDNDFMAVVTIFISTLLANFSSALNNFFSIPAMTTTNLTLIKQTNIYIMMIIYLIALLIIFAMYLYKIEYGMSVIKTIKKDIKVILSVFICFIFSIFVTTSILSITNSVMLSSFITIILISYFSKEDLFAIEYDDDRLLIKSALIVILAIIASMLINYSIIISLVILSLVYVLVQKTYEIENEIDYKKMIILVISYIILATFIITSIEISSINNAMYGVDISEFLVSEVSSSATGLAILFKTLSFNYFIPFIDVVKILPSVNSVYYLLFLNYFVSVFLVFNFYTLYLMFSYVKLNKKDTQTALTILISFVSFILLIMMLVVYLTKGI